MTAPPDEYSLRVFGGRWGFYRVTFTSEWRRIFSVHITQEAQHEFGCFHDRRAGRSCTAELDPHAHALDGSSRGKDGQKTYVVTARQPRGSRRRHGADPGLAGVDQRGDL